MSQYLEKAKALRAETPPRYNCAQTLVATFAEAAGLDEALALKISVNFGGGMKRGGTCGTVTGALIVFGLFGVNDPATLQRFYRAFEAHHGGLWDCRDLLKANAATGRPKKEHCDAMIYDTVELIEEILTERGCL